MNYQPTMAEAQAMGICFLARQPGLPEVHSLRVSVVQLHPLTCGWCDYAPLDLIAMLKARHTMAIEESRWWALPGQARLAAIKLAQHGGQA
jgi:hypothetical protein